MGPRWKLLSLARCKGEGRGSRFLPPMDSRESAAPSPEECERCLSEPVLAPLQQSFSRRRCSLLEVPRICQYRMRLGDSGAPWHHISQLCRNRVRSSSPGPDLVLGNRSVSPSGLRQTTERRKHDAGCVGQRRRRRDAAVDERPAGAATLRCFCRPGRGDQRCVPSVWGPVSVPCALQAWLGAGWSPWPARGAQHCFFARPQVGKRRCGPVGFAPGSAQ